MIDDLYQDGTDAVLADMVRRPRPEPAPAGPGLFSGTGKSVAANARAGAARTLAFGADIIGAFGSVAGAYPETLGVNMSPEQKKQADDARKELLKAGPTYTSESGNAFRQSAAGWLPDPATTGTAAQIIGGFVGFGTEYATSALFGGPLAPLVLGGATAFDEADKLRLEGVDLATRTQAGLVTGVANAAMVAAPMTAATRLGAAAKGVAVGEGTIIGQTAAVQTILKHAGYDKIGDTYDPFDPVALAVGLVPGALGAMLHRGKVEPLKSVKTEADVKAAVQLSPEEQARSNAYEASPANLKELQQAIAKEKNPASKALLEEELAKQTKMAAAIEANPELVRAARTVQTAQAADSARLTADTDLVGMNQHDAAMARAHEQLANGDRVDVSDIVGDRFDPTKVEAATARMANAMSDAEVEARFMARLEDHEAAVKGYAERPDSHGGRVLNTDIARELSPDYLGDRTRSAAVHEPASSFIKKLYAEKLANLKEGEQVVFTSGGTGAGKTSAIESLPALKAMTDKAAIVYDTNMNTFASAKAKVDQALAAGGDVNIVHVQRDPVEALTGGALPRAMRQEAKFGTGRTVPLAEHARTHRGAAQVLQQMAEHYKDDPRVSIHVIDNTRGRGMQRLADLAFVAAHDYNGVEGKLHEALETARSAGKISESVYAGTVGEIRGEPPVGKATGRGDGQGPAGNDAGKAPVEPQPAGHEPSATAEQATAFDRNLAQLEAASPDMPVQLEGGEKTTLSQALAEVRAQFAAETMDAQLAQVAAECFLRAGP